MKITWREDVKRWHPGQEWIWQPGGFGVFDPGINALSIVTKILPEPIFVEQRHDRGPRQHGNAHCGQIRFKRGDGGAKADLTAEFDWRQKGGETWEIEIAHDRWLGAQSQKGRSIWRSGGKTASWRPPLQEYEMIYAQASRNCLRRKSEMDVSPLQLVCDCFMLGRPVLTRLSFKPRFVHLLR